MFQQDKKHIADFMIEFDTLAMKVETNNMHAIFLLKKNVRVDIIKTILGYLPIAAPDTLKEWKMVITLVGQGVRHSSHSKMKVCRVGSNIYRV